FNTSGVVPIQTEHASTTIHGINVKINDSPEKMCGITRRDARVPVRAASRHLSAANYPLSSCELYLLHLKFPLL
ncbi:MAG: hypothetical protein LBQ66_00325, partial [Planctomycetaceae bacterium]|nr:hypothetical protein [Planctomycetaceae bacterium]